MKKFQINKGGIAAIAAIAVITLSACTPAESVVPTGSLSSPLESPLAPAKLAYAKPRAGMGGASGRLISKSSGYELPYVGGDLYLGAFLAADKSNAPPMVAFSVDKDPKAVVYQADGQFAFTDIAPGTYTLIVWNPTTSFVVENPGQGAIKVVIESDKVTELGSINIP